MLRLRLLHWNAEEAAALIATLRRARYRVEYDEEYRPALLKFWRESPPAAFVIDLSRLPSHGREIAVALRQSPKTRFIPLVFCDGQPAKVNAVRQLLPDASFCTRTELSATLQEALRKPIIDPVKPGDMMDRYQHRTAAQKLAIATSSVVALIHPPARVLAILGELPPKVEIRNELAPNATVTLCFVHQPDAVASAISEVRHHAVTGKLWILWRKGGSAARGDVTEALVRQSALDLGLVDYKICSVDPVWTAMLFARKK